MKMEIPNGLKTLRWADDIALLKAEFKDEISVKRLNRLGMLVEALKAENEELKAKLDKAKWSLIDNGTPIDVKMLIGCWYQGKWYEDAGTLCGKNGRRTICVGFRKNEWPTHYMPLPDAPEQR